MLPEVGSLLVIISGRSFRRDVAFSHGALDAGEIVLVLHAQYVSRGGPFENYSYYTYLLVASTKGIGWIFALTATCDYTWTQIHR